MPMIPVRAVDSHAHVFDPVRFPLRDTGGHMPAPNECGTPAQFLNLLDAHGITHGLLVNPQAGYAIIRPGGGCPACSTLGAVMP